jgi:hypothetical protein
MKKYNIIIAMIFLTLVIISCEDEEDFSKRLYVGGKVNVYYTISDSMGTDFNEKVEEQYGMPIRFQMFENGTYLKDVITDSWGYIMNTSVSEGKEYQLKFVIEDNVLFESDIYIPNKNEGQNIGSSEAKVDFMPRRGLRLGYHFELKDFEMRIENNPDRLFVYPNPFNVKTELYVTLTSSRTFSIDMFNLYGDKYVMNEQEEQELNRTLPNVVNTAKLGDSLLPDGYYLFRVINGDETFFQMAVGDSSVYSTIK